VIVYTDKHRTPFKIDKRDFELVARYPWCLGSSGYVVTSVGKWPKTCVTTLHQILLGRAPKGHQWDHKNRNKLDYRRINLRLVTSGQNAQNRSAKTNSISGIRGVSFVLEHGRRKRWVASVSREGSVVYRARFNTKAQAAKAARAARKKLLPFATH
jgi:hypothetical protein